MARLLSITQQNYSKYEAGLVRPSVDMQARIAALLGVSQRDVFPESDAVSA